MSIRQATWFGFVLRSSLALSPLAVAAPVLGQPVIRQGGELQVNRYTFLNQLRPAVALDGNGDFVVTWTDDAHDGQNKGIFGLRFDSAGTPLGNDFQVNTYTTQIQHFSSVAAESNGDFVVVWHSFTQDGPNNYSVFGQRYSSTGAPAAAEFRVNTYTLSYQLFARVASDADGDFVVVWQSLLQDGSSYGVFGQRFDSSGAKLGAEFMANTFTAGNQQSPDVAADADGDFVVVWESFNQDGSVYGVFGRRYDSAGNPLGSVFQLSSYTSNNQNRPAVAAEADGDFVVVWQSLHQESPGTNDGSYGIFARRFGSSGAGLGSEFQVNVQTLGYQRYPRVAISGAGDFVVTWESSQQDGSYAGIFARRFSVIGVARGSEFQANSYTSTFQRNAAVDFDGDGNFVIVWESAAPQDGNASGIFAQRFSLPPLAVLDVDGDGALGALTDGILVLRHLFGFTGPTLASGAIALYCTRCDGPAVTAYLNGLGLVLDIDGNGLLGPLTDGILVLRFLFGFTGTSLVGGAVAGPPNMCTRCTAGDVLAYLQTID